MQDPSDPNDKQGDVKEAGPKKSPRMAAIYRLPTNAAPVLWMQKIKKPKKK